MKTAYIILSFSLFFTLNALSQSSKTVSSLTTVSFKKILDSKSVTLIDIRTKPEFAAGHIPGAINIDLSDPDFVYLVKKRIKKNKPLAIYCRSGHRSKIAISKLGYVNVMIYELDQGFIDWQKAGFPVKK